MKNESLKQNFVISCMMVVLIPLMPINAGEKANSNKVINGNAMLDAAPTTLMPWSPLKEFDDLNDYEHLQVEVLHGADAILHINRRKKLIFRFSPGLSFSEAIILDDGNLLTLWHGVAGSYQQMYVFGYTHGKIRELLHLGMRVRPEFAYVTHGKAGPLSTKEDKNGKRHWRDARPLVESIIVSQVDADWNLVSADVYTWNESTGKYDSRRNVPWSKRLQPG
ncbi:MAG TPA: hypothetical protein PKZ32_21140 [Candidatus Melainabacteria bacterium]|nr:hypothetical protein [Candidatus Melainabacteria bacterium]